MIFEKESPYRLYQNAIRFSREIHKLTHDLSHWEDPIILLDSTQSLLVLLPLVFFSSESIVPIDYKTIKLLNSGLMLSPHIL